MEREGKRRVKGEGGGEKFEKENEEREETRAEWNSKERRAESRDLKRPKESRESWCVKSEERR